MSFNEQNTVEHFIIPSKTPQQAGPTSSRLYRLLDVGPTLAMVSQSGYKPADLTDTSHASLDLPVNNLFSCICRVKFTLCHTISTLYL
jgi:hypothetical protein